MQAIAHTAPKDKPNLALHLYKDHIHEALTYGLSVFEYVLSFSSLSKKDKFNLYQTLFAAIMLHDLGKLDERNQQVLTGQKNGRLPIDHIEAGVALAQIMKNELLAWLIRGHHAPGLPSKKSEKQFISELIRQTDTLEEIPKNSLRGKRHKRVFGEINLKEVYLDHLAAILETNKHIDDYKSKQLFACGYWPEISMKLPESALTTRLMLSCLTDADHGSTASYSRGVSMPIFNPAPTSWDKRLIALNRYVENLMSGTSGEADLRNQLRGEFYQRCYAEDLLESTLIMCSAPVGLGKTTSVTAYLLRKCIKNNSSRMIIIAPFSNIIDQTVKTLRKAIVLEGEDPKMIVAAHHHKAEFTSLTMREYSTCWQAPIIVTTAVQFFETLASAHPSKLRKLSAIAGSAIFIDESHACLPTELLKISWSWLKYLSELWGCDIVFSSGSMVEYWTDEIIIGHKLKMRLPDLFPESLKAKAQLAEVCRVEFKTCSSAFSCDDLIEFLSSPIFLGNLIHEIQPCCLVILNTVQSAAFVAYFLAKLLNNDTDIKNKSVLHLSTALAPKDREKILAEVKRRQCSCEWDHSIWYLIATSCVEAGVDLDFSVGLRERCSITSFLQVSGRINRHGKRTYGVLYDFIILEDGHLTHHPSFKDSSEIFSEMWSQLIDNKSDITKISTSAIRKEFTRFEKKELLSEQLLKNEEDDNFQNVMDDYKIIQADTATVIISKEIVESLEMGIYMKWQDIQENSVQLWMTKISKLNLKPIKGCQNDDIYSWIDVYEYDPNFLGIMAGLINPNNFFEDTNGVL